MPSWLKIETVDTFDQVKWPSLPGLAIVRWIDRSLVRPRSRQTLAVSVLVAGIIMMMWLLNFQENSADMVWWLSTMQSSSSRLSFHSSSSLSLVLSRTSPSKNSSLDGSKKMDKARNKTRTTCRRKKSWKAPPDVNRNGSIEASYFNRCWFQYAMQNASNASRHFCTFQ